MAKAYAAGGRTILKATIERAPRAFLDDPGRIAGAARRDLRRLGFLRRLGGGRGRGRRCVDAPGPAFWCMVDALTMPAPEPEPWSVFE